MKEIVNVEIIRVNGGGGEVSQIFSKENIQKSFCIKACADAYLQPFIANQAKYEECANKC